MFEKTEIKPILKSNHLSNTSTIYFLFFLCRIDFHFNYKQTQYPPAAAVCRKKALTQLSNVNLLTSVIEFFRKGVPLLYSVSRNWIWKKKVQEGKNVALSQSLFQLHESYCKVHSIPKYRNLNWTARFFV